MSTGAKIGKKAIWLAHGVINTFLLIIILLLLVFACYAIWDSNQVHRDANSARYEKFKPTVENAGASFDELRAINPDVFAWLTVYGTHIDYPVVQGKDNLRYVNTDVLGNYSLSGAIFLDYLNSPDFSDFNNILYGHHMEKMTMFGEIGQFADKSYFDARKYGRLYYGGQEHGLEFFAIVHTDAYNNAVFRPNVKGEDAQQKYLDMLLEMAIHIREEVTVTTEDRIVLLSTCSETTTNGRDMLLARITDEVYSDTFIQKAVITKYLPISSIDELPGLFENSSLGMKAIMLMIPLLLIILIIVVVRAFRQRKRVRTRRRGDE